MPTRVFQVFPGDRYGRWTVIREVDKRKQERYVECQCDCGTIKTVGLKSLCRGSSTSCGCKLKDAQPPNTLQPLPGETIPRCTDCGEPMTRRVDNTTKRGWRWRCASCTARRMKERAPQGRSAYERVRAWRERNPRLFKVQQANQILSGYGMTLEDFVLMRANQGGVCRLCPAELDERPTTFTHVDHCHQTGVVRGILCTKCNRGLGFFDDDPELLEKAASYLREATVGTAPRAA
jgi:hypothetical protein